MSDVFTTILRTLSPDHAEFLKIDRAAKDARIQELLESNNELLERAREAERERDNAIAGIGAAARFITVMSKHLKDDAIEPQIAKNGGK